MAYTPENNPYIPGDPYSYDLKWMVNDIKHMEERFGELDSQVQEATDQADRSRDEADRSRDEADRSDAEALKSEGFAVGEQDGAAVDPDSPYYENNAKFYAEKAQLDGHAEALKAEGFAIGEQDGTPVSSGSPYYENNSKYYAQEAADSEQAAADYAAHIADPVSGLVTTWLADNISQPTTPAIDESLTVSGAAADSFITGRIARNIEMLTGFSSNEYDAAKDILYISAFGIDITGYRIGVIANTALNPRKIMLHYNGGSITFDMPGNHMIKEVNGGYICIGCDWDNHTTDINLTYANAHIAVASTVRESACMDVPISILKDSFIAHNIKLLPGYSDNEYNAAKDILYVGAIDIDISGYRLGVIVNTAVTPRKIMLEYNGGAITFDMPGDHMVKEVDGGFICIGCDWNNHTSDINLTYANAHIAVDESVKALDCITPSINRAGGYEYDRKVVVQLFGDSITDESWRADQTSWATLLADYFGADTIDIENFAVAGSGFGHNYSGTGRYSNLTYNYVNDMIDDPQIFDPDADATIIFAGTNNWSGSETLGQFGDTTIATFYGAVWKALEDVTSNNKGPCFICTPCARYNAQDQTRQTDTYGAPINNQGNTLRDFCDAIVEVANFFGCPVIDLNYDLGWNRLNINDYSYDGLHPAPLGSAVIAKFIASKLREHNLEIQ